MVGPGRDDPPPALRGPQAEIAPPSWQGVLPPYQWKVSWYLSPYISLSLSLSLTLPLSICLSVFLSF